MSTLQTTTSTDKNSLSPAVGETYFETDTKNIIVYDGTDWRGYANDGVIFSSNSYSVDFDGTGDYIDISGASGLFNSATTLSISAWYYMDALNAPIVSGGGSGTNGVWIYNSGSSNNVVFAVRNGSSSTDITTAVPSTGQWVHVAGTYNAGSGTLYVTPLGGSTTTVSSSTLPSSLSSTAGSNLSIGRFAPGVASVYHNGKIDEVAIWNRQITSTEVSNIISNKLYDSPSAMWRLENTVDATIGGSGYDGTNNGATFKAKADDTTNTPY